MGNMYQKRKGRSWDLRKQSIELWPQWITILQKFNCELNIEKPLIQLTTNEEKFKKLEKFIYENNDTNLRSLERDSIFIKNINKAFQTKNLKGMISLKDGRINAISLLKTLDKYLKHKKINFLEEEIINSYESKFQKDTEEGTKNIKFYRLKRTPLEIVNRLFFFFFIGSFLFSLSLTYSESKLWFVLYVISAFSCVFYTPNRKALKELIAAWPNIEDLIKGRSLWRKGK